MTTRAPGLAFPRRDFAALVASCIGAVACRRAPDGAPSASSSAAPSASASSPIATKPRPPPRDLRAGMRILDWTFPDDARWPWDKRAVVIVPDPIPVGTKLPLLIALHGMGETIDPTTGAYGWLKSYELDVAIDALVHPPLDVEDFRDLVTDERRAQINAQLEAAPYKGLVVCTPYIPSLIGTSPGYDDYAGWIGEQLMPRLKSEAPILGTPASSGIDGVSLGGISALQMGLRRRDLFGAVGALQPAVAADPSWLDGLADFTKQTIAARPLRITTSENDYYRDALILFSQKLGERGVKHEFSIAVGPHDYIWNKGPGAIEMLLWHDRVLARS